MNRLTKEELSKKLSAVFTILRTLFYCGIKTKKWYNVHHEVETAESGRYYALGEARMYHFTERWFYIIGIPIIQLYFNREDKGLYEISQYKQRPK